MKEIIMQYYKKKGNKYCAMIDLSKAHDVMIDKLLKWSLPTIIDLIYV